MGIFVEVVGEENVLYRPEKSLRQAAHAGFWRTWKMEAAGNLQRQVGRQPTSGERVNSCFFSQHRH